MNCEEALKQFENRKVLCVGDVMLDRYVYGSSERLSPEAPVPVLSIERQESRLGGAGTVLRNLSALGAVTTFISVVGGDQEGFEITKLIGKEKNILPYVITEQLRTSTVKTRFISGTHQIARADQETCEPVNPITCNHILSHVRRNIADCEVLILSDYGKGVLCQRTSQEIIRIGIDAGKTIIVDPKSKDFGQYAGATIVTPNLHELTNAVTEKPRSDGDILNAALYLINLHKLANILVTRGKDGMTLINGSGEIHNIPSFAQEVFDVTGAGDTVVATLALGIASGLELKNAAYLANVAAGIVVGKLGTATVSPDELRFACMEMA